MHLKIVLKNKAISQNRLSVITGIASQDISAILNNRKYCYGGWRKRISESLEIPEEELFPEYFTEQQDHPVLSNDEARELFSEVCFS